MSTWRNTAWYGCPSSITADDQQSALLSLSTLADCVQLAPHPSSTPVPPPPSVPPAAAAAVAFAPSFVYGSPTGLPAYTATMQVREVTRTSDNRFAGSRLPTDIEEVWKKTRRGLDERRPRPNTSPVDEYKTDTYNNYIITLIRFADSRNKRSL